ncbi:hypothetical protein CMI47_07415 [Candidatus Pacearchaeota archaeon]|nr:hypothetical protein [Candidatus Pacearchaeota archaeon]
MDINELSDHGVTILVRCRDYDGGKDLGWGKDTNEAHLWTDKCKPWDVVSVVSHATDTLVDMDSFGDKVR